MIKTIFSRYFEIVCWAMALVSLAAADPNVQSQFTLCPLKLMGISWCPGCGLGHSISFLLHGEFRNSLRSHWLGAPALLIIIYRIFVLARLRFAESPYGSVSF